MNKLVTVRYYERDLEKDPKPYDPLDATRADSVKDYRFQIDESEVSSRYNLALLIPPIPADGRYSYQKFAAECIVNTLAQFRSSMRPNMLRLNGTPASEADPDLTEHMLNVDLLNQFNAILGLLQHMVHSTSWQAAGPYYDFDRFEINRRLEMLKVRLSPPHADGESQP